RADAGRGGSDEVTRGEVAGDDEVDGRHREHVGPRCLAATEVTTGARSEVRALRTADTRDCDRVAVHRHDPVGDEVDGVVADRLAEGDLDHVRGTRSVD